MMSKMFDSITSKVIDFTDDPLGESLDYITQPARDFIEVIDGMCEGELRVNAAFKLGTDMALGMSVEELISWYEEEGDIEDEG